MKNAAEEKSHRAAAARHRGVDTHGTIALGTLREVCRDEGQRRRRGDSAAHSLEATSNDQPKIGGREAAEQRRDRKDCDADHEHPALAVEITRSPTEEQQSTKGQRVRRDEPFEIGLGEM